MFPKIEQLGHMVKAVADPKILANGHELYINFELLGTSSMTSLSRMCLHLNPNLYNSWFYARKDRGCKFIIQCFPNFNLNL